MIIKYDRLKGVPKNHYYLVQIICVGDFGAPYEDKIVYHSSSREDLIELCERENWDLTDGWCQYRISLNK